MHNDSVDFVVKSIQKSPLVNLNGLIYQEYQDFFDDIWLEKFNFDYNNIKTVKLQKQEDTARLKIDYSEKISKQLNILFRHKKIMNCLQEIFLIKLKPSTSDIWIDLKGYRLSPHTDDKSIKLALQIYIGDQQQPGTSFYDASNIYNKLHEVSYKKNKGYALLNNEKSFHGVSPTVAEGQRISAYVRYE